MGGGLGWAACSRHVAGVSAGNKKLSPSRLSGRGGRISTMVSGTPKQEYNTFPHSQASLNLGEEHGQQSGQGSHPTFSLPHSAFPKHQ